MHSAQDVKLKTLQTKVEKQEIATQKQEKACNVKFNNGSVNCKIDDYNDTELSSNKYISVSEPPKLEMQ